MQAKDVMTKNVVAVRPDSDVRTIARRLIERGISAVPVVDGSGHLVGIVSEGDLLRRADSGTERRPSWWLRLLAGPEDRARDYVKSHAMRAEDVMTRDVITVAEDAPLHEIATILERQHIKRVPVVCDGQVVGIVSRANLLHGLASGAMTCAVSLSDSQLREALEKAMAEAGVRTDFMNIVVADGAVHLWGAMESEAEKQAARVAAENLPGVKGVRDETSVFPASVRAMMWAE